MTWLSSVKVVTILVKHVKIPPVAFPVTLPIRGPSIVRVIFAAARLLITMLEYSFVPSAMQVAIHVLRLLHVVVVLQISTRY